MPKAASIAIRLAAQALVLQGFANNYIGEKLNIKPQTVQKWRERNGWNTPADVAKAEAVAQREIVQAATVQLVKDPDETVSKASETTRKRTAKAIVDALNQLPCPDSWKQAAKQQSELEPLVRNARAVFGWNDSSGEPTINIARMALCTLVDVESLSAQTSLNSQLQQKHALIDVTSTTNDAQPLLTTAVDGQYMI